MATEDLNLTASAARQRVELYRLERERAQALARVRGTSLTAAWKPLSSDFLSAKAKMQPRDSKGRWIDTGASVRWLKGSQIGGKRSGVGKREYSQGKVTSYDPASKKYTIKPDDGSPDIELEGKNLEVIKAIIPDTPEQARAVTPSGDEEGSQWEDEADELTEMLTQLGADHGTVRDEIAAMSENPASSDQEQFNRLRKAFEEDEKYAEQLSDDDYDSVTEFMRGMSRIGVSDDEDTWTDKQRGAMGDTEAPAAGEPEDREAENLADLYRLMDQLGMGEGGHYVSEEVDKMRTNPAASEDEQRDRLIEAAKKDMADSEHRYSREEIEDLYSEIENLEQIGVYDDGPPGPPDSGTEDVSGDEPVSDFRDPRKTISKRAADLQEGDIIAARPGRDPVRVTYVEDVNNRDYPFVGGTNLKTGRYENVGIGQGYDPQVTVYENPDLIQDPKDAMAPNNEVMARNLYNMFGKGEEYDKEKWLADAAELKAASGENDFTPAQLRNALLTKYGTPEDRSNRSLQNEHFWDRKARSVLNDNPVLGGEDNLRYRVEEALRDWPEGVSKPVSSLWARDLAKKLMEQAPSGNITEMARVMYDNLTYGRGNWDEADQQVWLDAARKVMEKRQ